MTSAVPICAICNKPVDYFECFRDHARGQSVFDAKCHGETQRVILNDRDLQRAGPHGITMGRAFEDMPVLLPGEDFDPGPPTAFDEFCKAMFAAIVKGLR